MYYERKNLSQSALSKSRQTLQLLKDQCIEPEIIEYLKTPPSAEELDALLVTLDLEPRRRIRSKEAEYKEQGLNDLSLTTKPD